MSAKRWIRSVQTALLAGGGIPAALAAQPAPPAGPSAAPTTLPAAPAPPAPPPAPALPPATPPGLLDVPAAVRRSIQEDRRLLTSGTTQTEREEAARRLVARQSPEVDAALREIAADRGNAGARLAIARAVADDPTPDPQLINPLSSMLGLDRQSTLDAATALAAYSDRPTALDTVRNFIRDMQMRQDSAAVANRAAAVRALGASTDQSAASDLMTIVRDARTPGDVRSAGFDALVEMTLLKENARDLAAWEQWWSANNPQVKSALQFKAGLANRFKRPRGGASPELESLLQDLYRQSAADERPAFLKRTLTSADSGQRVAGVHLVTKFEVFRGVKEEVRRLVRPLISDNAPEVRLAVADLLLARIADKDSLLPLLVQLAQEPDPVVRAAIVGQLAQLADLRAVQPVIDKLNDPSMQVAVAAAAGLGRFAPVLRTDPQTARAIMQALRQAADGRGRKPGGDPLRAACIDALGQYGAFDPQLGNQLVPLLNAQEPGPVRKAVLTALMKLDDQRQAAAIANWVRIERDPDVEATALEALGAVGKVAFAPLIFSYTNPENERNELIRSAAWDVFKKLLPQAPLGQLTAWLNDPSLRNDVDRRLSILQVMMDKQTGNEKAMTTESIGEALMQLKQSPPQPEQAATYFKRALDYWMQNNAQGQVTDNLITEYLRARLSARQYAEAVRFAGDMIGRDKGQMPRVGGQLAKWVEDLVTARAARDAVSLSTEIEKMNPPLDANYRDRVRAAREDAQRLLAAPQAPGARGGGAARPG